MRGGARPGAGRKSIAEEFRTADLARKAIIEKYGSLEAGLVDLLKGDPVLKRFVFEHALGKPQDNLNLEVTEPIKELIFEKASRKDQ